MGGGLTSEDLEDLSRGLGNSNLTKLERVIVFVGVPISIIVIIGFNLFF